MCLVFLLQIGVGQNSLEKLERYGYISFSIHFEAVNPPHSPIPPSIHPSLPPSVPPSIPACPPIPYMHTCEFECGAGI